MEAAVQGSFRTLAQSRIDVDRMAFLIRQDVKRGGCGDQGEDSPGEPGVMG
jgi:hypothetical protein